MEMIEGDPPYWAQRSLKALFYTALYGPPPIRATAKPHVSDELVDFVQKRFVREEGEGERERKERG